jgi:hypothetical protein
MNDEFKDYKDKGLQFRNYMETHYDLVSNADLYEVLSGKRWNIILINDANAQIFWETNEITHLIESECEE